jgi:hypothetical protein
MLPRLHTPTPRCLPTSIIPRFHTSAPRYFHSSKLPLLDTSPTPRTSKPRYFQASIYFHAPILLRLILPRLDTSDTSTPRNFLSSILRPRFDTSKPDTSTLRYTRDSAQPCKWILVFRSAVASARKSPRHRHRYYRFLTHHHHFLLTGLLNPPSLYSTFLSPWFSSFGFSSRLSLLPQVFRLDFSRLAGDGRCQHACCLWLLAHCSDRRVWARLSCLGPERGSRAEHPRASLA